MHATPANHTVFRTGQRRRLAALAVVLSPSFACGGPPFLTDDPEPVAVRHSEFYMFATLDRTRDDTQIQAPAVEFNTGVATNLQAHAIFPMQFAAPRNGPRAYGIGDTEFGVKYRFLQESAALPMAGVFPLLETPTGAADRDLGNGRAWVKLPLWLQKSWGPEDRPWTTYGGCGYACNRAPGQRNYPFGGWLLQKQLNETLSLAGELFVQGRNADTSGGFIIANAGGSCLLAENLSLLFSVGHSLAGDNHLIGYLGLYRTW